MGILLIMFRKIWSRHERGSITLEAAIAVPLLLMFIVALSAFIRLCMMEAGLRSAVNQAAHQLAVQAYPLQRLSETLSETEFMQKLNDWIDKYESGKREVEDWLDEYGELIPAPIREAMVHALQSADKLEDGLTEPVRAAFKPLVAHYLPPHMEDERLTVRSLYYPILAEGRDRDLMLKLEAEYEVPLHVPFMSRTIKLRAVAWERLWVGEQI
jgi:hypothetical protein